MAKVIILRGLPGSGKSTIAANMAGSAYRDDFVICSANHFFIYGEEYRFDPTKLPEAHATCLKKFMKYACTPLHAGFMDTIVVDNTNLSAAEIAPYYAIAQAYGHDVEIVSVVCPLDVAFARQTHGVPAGTFDRMAMTFRKGMDDMPPWWKRTEIVTG